MEIELILTDQQAAIFGPVLDMQRKGKHVAIYCIVTDSYVPSAGCGVVRLQMKIVSRKVSMKIERLIRQEVVS